MISNSTAYLTGQATGALTANVYSAYNLAGVAPVLVSSIFLVIFITTLIFYPRHVKRVIYGYITFALVGVLWLIGYGVFMSSKQVVAALRSFLYDFGVFLINYPIPIGLSLVLAYFVGMKTEFLFDGMFEDENKRRKKK